MPSSSKAPAKTEQPPAGSAATATASANLADSVIRILLASDTHLGLNERDPIRKDDAKNTFEEIFRIAIEQRADMVLLTGNLFHENKPSRRAMQTAIEVLRNHCLGDGDVSLDILSDQGASFHGNYKSVNFEDPNYNVQLPVFAIHGDHDDPGGEGGLSALDLLASANLLNYFGKVPNTAHIALTPLLIRKGTTKLALYGLGHVNNDQLTRALERKEFNVARPSSDPETWFNVLALHQNRAKTSTGTAGAVKEALLPSCMDLVLWGHERECTLPTSVADAPVDPGVKFAVLQPGATVATELADVEAGKKCVALLQVCGDNYKFEPIELQTARPFVLREVVLASYADERELESEEGLAELLAEQVEDMLLEVHAKFPTTPLTAADENRQKYPLLRLKVDYTGFSTLNPQKFGARFVERVANPSSMLKFHRSNKGAKTTKESTGGKEGGKRKMASELDEEALPSEVPQQIQGLVSEMLAGNTKDQLRLLPQRMLDAAVFEGFVGKEEKGAIQQQTDQWLEETRKKMQRRMAAEMARADGDAPNLSSRKDHEKLLERIAQEEFEAAEAAATAEGVGTGAAGGRSSGAGPSGVGSSHAGRRPAAAAAAAAGDLEDDFENEDLSGLPSAPSRGGGLGSDDQMDDEEDEEAPARLAPKAAAKAAAKAPPKAKAPAAARGGAAGRGRGGRAGRGGGRQTTLPVTGGWAAKSNVDVVDLDGDDEPAPTPAPTIGGKRAAPAAAASSSRPKRAKDVRTYDDEDEDDDDGGDGDDGSDLEEMAPSKRSSAFNARRRQR